MKKIIISGFSHTGTTILRAIIGHCNGVYEVSGECTEITQEMEQEAKEKGFRAIVIKTTEYTRRKDYKDYHRILLIRDPLYVFSSILRRKGEIPEKLSLKEYKRRVSQWINTRDDGVTFNLRYEDLFKDDFAKIKSVLKAMKIRTSKKVFDNSKWINKTGQQEEVPEDRPEETEHGQFRMWQINQPIRNMNDPERISLTPRLIEKITESELIYEAGYNR